MARATASSRIGHVRLNGAVFYAFHGVSDGERQLGAQYEIDIDLQCDLAAAATSDALDDAVNYETVYARVNEIMSARQFRLMEAIASHIVDALFAAFPTALAVSVDIRKLNPPIKGLVRSAEVSLAMPRTEWKKIH